MTEGEGVATEVLLSPRGSDNLLRYRALSLLVLGC